MLNPEDDLGLIASAARARIEEYRIERERETAIRRVRAGQNITAAWKPLSSDFLSAKAKLQPRDSKGRWIDMGATVRWLNGTQIGGNKGDSSGAKGRKSYSQGEVRGFDAKTQKYQIEPSDGGKMIELEGKNLEVIKAVIPETPEEAKAAKPAGGGGLTDKNGKDLAVGDKVKLNGYMVGEITSGPDDKGRYEGKNDNGGGHMYFKPGDDLELYRKGTGGGGGDKPPADPPKPPTGGNDKPPADPPTPPSGGSDQPDAPKSVKDVNGDEVKIGDQVDWARGEYGGKDYPVVGFSESGDLIVKNPHVKDHDQLTTLSPFEPQKSWEKATTFTKAIPDAPMTPELESAIAQMKDAARWAGFSNDGYDKNASGREAAFSGAAKKLQKQGLTPELIAELRADGEKSAQARDSAMHDNYNPFDNGHAKGSAEAADKLEKLLPGGGGGGDKPSADPPPTDAPAPDAPAPEAEEVSPLDAIQQRTGLTDEEMADAPEPLQMTELLRERVEDLDYLDPEDMENFHAYLDEIQIGDARTPGQFDEIRELLQDRRRGYDEDDFNNVLDTWSAARGEALDSAGSDTIESLDKPAPQRRPLEDLPDATDDALTVPEDWKTDGSIREPDTASDAPDAKLAASRLIAEFDASQRQGADWAVPKDAANPDAADVEHASKLQELLKTKGIEAVAQELWRIYGKDNSGGMDWLSEWTRNKWIQTAKNIFEKGA